MNCLLVCPRDDYLLECRSVVSCFWILLVNLPEEGNIHAILGPVNKASPDYIWRVFYDISFYIWVKGSHSLKLSGVFVIPRCFNLLMPFHAASCATVPIICW